MKKIIRAIYRSLPEYLQRKLYFMLFAIRRPKIFPALREYTYTDEHLKFVHLLECMNYIHVAGANSLIPATYFEFGCHSARTFSAAVRAAKFLGMTDAQFYAFDSFEGLPPTDPKEDGAFITGSFATSQREFVRIVQKKTGVKLPDQHVIKGFYSESLKSSLQSRMPKAGVIHVDVDLYSSTMEVLQFVKPLLVVGTVLVFDDWYCFPPGSNKGEMRAVKEFCEANPSFAIEKWKAYSTFGQSFFVTAVPQ